jgi:hypothetical protein
MVKIPTATVAIGGEEEVQGKGEEEEEKKQHRLLPAMTKRRADGTAETRSATAALPPEQ